MSAGFEKRVEGWKTLVVALAPNRLPEGAEKSDPEGLGGGAPNREVPVEGGPNKDGFFSSGFAAAGSGWPPKSEF